MADPEPYIVLARKYRPQKFSEIVGQPGMVRILENAFRSDRLAHAFILTGVRGVGKTTTARIIAKGLNCTGPDGEGDKTTEPCGICESCTQIAEGKHLDVMECDAASRTGVDDVRVLIDSVGYQTADARYRVYIIDEVHMLSKNAFNALLKTLEEPPPHVLFIFATTEIEKVPTTILSRCQRFDLRRVESETLTTHLMSIAKAEGVDIDDAALALLVRASEGSVRDAISLLDQAIAYSGNRVQAEQVREMLSIADRSRILDLLELILAGSIGPALEEFVDQYQTGADPEAILGDLADTVHWLSVVRFTKKSIDDPTLSPAIRERGAALSQSLPLPELARAWQILVKCLAELVHVPNTKVAVEMAIIRLCAAAELPTPHDLLRRLEGTDRTALPAGTPTAQMTEGALPSSSQSGEQADSGHARTDEDSDRSADERLSRSDEFPKAETAIHPSLESPLVQSALQSFPQSKVIVDGKQIN
ncbi:MAG: DNA polymerase III subunit gamma/tau [Rhodobacteraceae bacterium]|nr:DNA polymerase III subunit gamma/tau [Paracoccaceae bacterium]